MGPALLVAAVLAAAFVAGQLPPEEPEPEFLQPLENMTVTQGRHVSFTCVVNHLGSYKVAWIKSDSKAILAIHDHMVTHNPRLAVTHNGHNTWKLHVSNVQKNDSGTYMCQINTDPMRSQMGTLGVLIPPDILDDEASDGDNAAPEGGSVHLRCRATGVPDPTVLWRREDSRNIVFRHDGGREKQAMKTFDGETLQLTSIQRSDMGAYLCIASNSVPPSVSKRFIVQVHFHPLIKVSNQLVAAPLGSDVMLQCYVEASPKAMNSWYKDTGEKLMAGDKYVMEETWTSMYSLFMNLTIRSLEKRDFGGYVCTSVNALGKVEGGVRLQELRQEPKTTAAAPARHDKGRKKPAAHDKPRKKKKKKGERRGEEEGDASSAEEDGEDGLEPSVAGGGGAGGGGGGGAHHKKLRFALAKERKASTTLGIIMSAFVVCWLPFFVLALIRPFLHGIPDALSSVFLWLGYANSLFNPVIYATTNRDFRKPFQMILYFRCGSLNHMMREEFYHSQYGDPDNQYYVINTNQHVPRSPTCYREDLRTAEDPAGPDAEEEEGDDSPPTAAEDRNADESFL